MPAKIQRRKSWTAGENAQLAQAVALYQGQTVDWDTIARWLGTGRTAASVKQHYTYTTQSLRGRGRGGGRKKPVKKKIAKGRGGAGRGRGRGGGAARQGNGYGAGFPQQPAGPVTPHTVCFSTSTRKAPLGACLG